jgi:voltage-gated potassium channel Kch
MVKASAVGNDNAAPRDWWRLGAVLAAVVALVLGVVGLRITFPVWPLSELVYGALQLFVLEADRLGPPPYNGWLEVARFLAPATTAYAVFEALRALLGGELRRRRLARLRGHVVVCGDDAAVLLARAIRTEQGRRVVVVGEAASGARIGRPPAGGPDAVLGDPREPATLHAAGVSGAVALFACAVQPDVNAAVVLAAAQQRRGADPSAPRFHAFAEVGDNDLVEALRVRQVAAPRSSGVVVDFFSLQDAAARAVVETSGPVGPSGPVVIVGEAPFGLALLRALIRRTAPPSGWRIAVHTDDPAAAVAAADRLDAAGRGVEVTIKRLDDPVDDPCERIYVCRTGEEATLALALRLLHRPGRRVTACLNRAAPFAAALSGAPGLTVLGVLDEGCHPERIEADAVIGRAARAIHNRYVEERRAAGDTPQVNESMRAWADLPPYKQESNYAQAEHIGTKLRAIGAVLTTTPPAAPFAFRTGEVEMLARMEHDRWVEERTRAGFTYGPRRDDRHHPDLQDWEYLSPESRQKDVDVVTRMPELLASVGLFIGRTG